MDQLPNEILIKIFGYLSSYDLLQICEVFPNLEYFLKDKGFVRVIDFSDKYEVHNMNLCKSIITKMDPSLIKVLKINCIYWILGEDLRKVLKKLTNLEELYAIDTNLGFASNDVTEYFNLKKLAVSVKDYHFHTKTLKASKSLTLLRALYLKIIKTKKECDVSSGFNLFFSNVRQLEELWIRDDYEYLCRTNFQQLVDKLTNLTKVVVRTKSFFPFYDFTNLGLSKVFKCIRCTAEKEIIFERILKTKSCKIKSIFDPKETELEKAWDVFVSLDRELPCGPRECKLLHIKEDLNNIQFHELNFCYSLVFCSMQYADVTLQILVSKNCKDLKKLSFKSCLFQRRINETPEVKECGSSFKKIRIGVKQDTSNHPFEKISQNMKNLIELEIFCCLECSGSEITSAYFTLHNFKRLQILSLEIPYFINGSFLDKVFGSCQQLKSIHIKLIGPNEKFVTSLCQSLSLLPELKDFRFECLYLMVEKLLNNLYAVPANTLSRLFLKCDRVCYASNSNLQQIFKTFIEQNPQLIFLLLVVTRPAVLEINYIQGILHELKGGNPAKIFLAIKNINSLEKIKVPSAHGDIIYKRSNVSTIDFDKF